MNKRKTFLKGLLTGALSVIILMVLAGLLLYLHDRGSFSEKLDSMQALVKEKYLYYDDVDDETLEDGALSGYMQALEEPYSVYYNQEETTMLMESTAGEFGGIGITLTQDVETMEIKVVEVGKDTPGEAAGFLVGDIISKVDGEDVTGLELDPVVLKLRGEAGTSVEITVLRGNNLEEHTLSVTRELIEAQVVYSEMKEENIGYVQVTEFEKVASEQFENALENLNEQGMQALIIDLRNNPGGNLDTVCKMVDLILPEGIIVSTKDRNGKGDEYFSDEEHQLNLPMVVLVNENSASASEIFTGALKDYGKATIVGTTTFGKGIVQEIYILSDGSSVKITTSEYFTPNGENIHGVGIAPDVEIPLEYDEENPTYDNQLEKAIQILENGM